MEWLTVSDAAKNLSKILREEVTEADILRLALDDELTLSVYFVNHAKALIGKVVPLEDAECLETDDGRRLVVGVSINDNQVLELGDTPVTIRGVWDLLMIGNERLDVEHKYHSLTNGPEVTLVGLDGCLLKDQDGVVCQLQEYIEHFDGSTIKKLPIPAGGLPDDAVIVVRSEALRDLAKSISSTSEIPQTSSVESWTPEELEKLSKRHAELGSQEKVAKEYGISRQRVSNLLKRHQENGTATPKNKKQSPHEIIAGWGMKK
jgi:hypothetical protein